MSTSLQQNRRSYSTAGHLLSTRTTNFEHYQANRDFRKNRLACTNQIRIHHAGLMVKAFENNLQTDLTQKINQALQSSPQIGLPGPAEPADLCHLLMNDVLGKGDFNVYQGADLYEFFALETEPEHVSQVCLVNDHFMLVKMPESCWSRSSQIESIMEENESEDELQATDIRKESRSETGSAAAKYFRCKRSCKISPMHQNLNGELEHDTKALDVDQTNGVTKVLCNNNTKTAHKEVYTTITTISGPTVKSFYAKKAKNDEKEKTNKNDLKQKNISVEAAAGAGSRPNDQVVETHTVPTQTTVPGDNHYNSSMRESITLNPRGALVTPDITTLNGNIAAYYQHGAEQIGSMDPKKNQLKTQGHFKVLRWLLRAFRSRAPKKPKSKIHAVIYKTYFVRWKKSSSSEDDRTIDSGLGSDVAEVMPKLRRCQSASF